MLGFGQNLMDPGCEGTDSSFVVGGVEVFRLEGEKGVDGMVRLLHLRREENRQLDKDAISLFLHLSPLPISALPFLIHVSSTRPGA